MLEMYKKVVFENYANFNGRARRSEYWYFVLTNLCILISLLVVGGIIGALFSGKNGGAVAGAFCGYMVYALYSLVVMIPRFAAFARRMHDIGKSGWIFLIAFLPFGAIVLVVFLCTEGTRGVNKYGKDPKDIIEEINEIGKE